MSRATKIDPQRWYTLQEIVEQKMIPWASSYWSIRNLVTADLKSKKLLGTVTMGSGTNVRYQIKGSSIIKFIEKVAAGKIPATTISQKIWQTQEQQR